MSENYLNHHKHCLKALLEQAQQQPPFNLEDCDAQSAEFIGQLKELANFSQQNEATIELGQRLLCQVIAGYPHLTPLVARELLWFFGGDCLHFMPDEEIEKFQRLDEVRYESGDSPEFDYEAERAKVFGLH